MSARKHSLLLIPSLNLKQYDAWRRQTSCIEADSVERTLKIHAARELRSQVEMIDTLQIKVSQVCSKH